MQQAQIAIKNRAAFFHRGLYAAPKCHAHHHSAQSQPTRGQTLWQPRQFAPPLTPALAQGRLDAERIDATTDADIAAQQAADEVEAMQDAAQFARRVRRRLDLSQAELAARIQVSLDTIRNWEQGKRNPAGAAMALLKVLDKAPEAALAALH